MTNSSPSRNLYGVQKSFTGISTGACSDWYVANAGKSALGMGRAFPFSYQKALVATLCELAQIKAVTSKSVSWVDEQLKKNFKLSRDKMRKLRHPDSAASGSIAECERLAIDSFKKSKDVVLSVQLNFTGPDAIGGSVELNPSTITGVDNDYPVTPTITLKEGVSTYINKVFSNDIDDIQQFHHLAGGGLTGCIELLHDVYYWSPAVNKESISTWVVSWDFSTNTMSIDRA